MLPNKPEFLICPVFPGKQIKGSEWSLHSSHPGNLCARGLGELRAQAPFFQYLSSYFFFHIFQLLIHWISQECAKVIIVESPAAQPSLLGLFHWQGEPDMIRSEKSHKVLFSSLILLWTVGKWALISSVSILDHVGDPRSLGWLGYWKLEDVGHFSRLV